MNKIKSETIKFKFKFSKVVITKFEKAICIKHIYEYIATYNSVNVSEYKIWQHLSIGKSSMYKNVY